ncbi:YdeI family protein [Nanoarchaeota archaeon]
MKTIEVFTRKEFRKWLEKNHEKESKVAVIINKKHTSKQSPTHREMIEEAICFGWIDTVIKRLDEDKYVRQFTKRNKNSKWSNNTIRYAKELIKQKKMMPQGMKYYKEGLAKPTHDFGIPRKPSMPDELKKVLDKNKKAKSNFENYPPSTKIMFYRWILRGKREETRAKRIKILIEKAKVGNKDVFTTSQKVNRVK